MYKKKRIKFYSEFTPDSSFFFLHTHRRDNLTLRQNGNIRASSERRTRGGKIKANALLKFN